MAIGTVSRRHKVYIYHRLSLAFANVDATRLPDPFGI